MSMNLRVMNRPLVIEEERINFDIPTAQERNKGEGKNETKAVH